MFQSEPGHDQIQVLNCIKENQQKQLNGTVHYIIDQCEEIIEGGTGQRKDYSFKGTVKEIPPFTRPDSKSVNCPADSLLRSQVTLVFFPLVVYNLHNQKSRVKDVDIAEPSQFGLTKS